MNCYRLATLIVYMIGIALQVEARQAGEIVAHNDIDDFLQQKVKSNNDLDGIFAAAEEYRDKLSQQKFLFPSKRVQLLEQMLALRDSLTDCSMESFKFFEKAQWKWLVYARWTGKSANAVSKATIKHADYCLAKIVELKNKQLAELDPTDVSLVREYAAISKSVVIDKEKFVEGKLVQDKFAMLSDSKYELEVARLVAREHSKDRDQKSKKSGKDMCQNYIVSPCQRYVSRLSDVFDLWSWSKSRAFESSIQNEYDEMKQDFLGYKVCKYIIQNNWNECRYIGERVDKV